MKTILKLAFAAAAFIAPASMHGLLAQVDTCNYIMTTTHLLADSTQSARRVVSYYDGLGRPVQTLRRHAATNADDLVDLTEYDSLGRASRTWSPVAIWAAGGQLSTELLTSAAQSYYDDECPFSETLYDGSPLDRVRKVTGPGEAWHLAGRGVKSNYYTNTESVGTDSLHCIRFGFSFSGNTGITFTRDNLWPAGTLMVERAEDEDGRTLWVFKDMRDLVVLERRLAEAATRWTEAVYADTYYLYDTAGRLTAVLPPELSARFSDGTWSGSTGDSPEVEGYAFQYRYDARGRMIAKKLPGAGWTFYVYDQGDRLVLSQDGNQRERGEWSFRLQDALGRECLTGIMAGIYDAFANPLGSAQVRAIRNHGDGNYGSLHDYSVEGLSLPADAEALTVNWWDDYSFLGHESGMGGSLYGYTAPGATEPYGARYETSAAGLQTGHWSRTLGEVRQNMGPAVMETWYYDDHGRVVHHVKGYPSGRRVQERSGYDFVGNLTALGRTMYDGAGLEEHTEAYAYQYDNWGRLLSTTHALDGGTPTTLASNTYDSVGRLSGTTRGAIGATPGPASLSSTYAYNVRDWLTGISGSLFSEALTYETPRAGSSFPGQWGGNLSGIQWGSGDSRPYRYDYTYDLLGRLTRAAYDGDQVLSEHSRTYSFDLNGNMTGRNAMHSANSLSGARTEWTWDSGDGNRPEAWHQERNNGLHPNPGGFIGPTQVADEAYAYDANGNRTAVMNALGDTLSVMRYNLLNLPEEYVATAGDTVKYVYSSDGEKLYVAENPSGSTARGTEYAANYRIENGAVTMIHTDAGYYTPVTSQGGLGISYSHIWYLKDHLGNNRVLADGSGNALKNHHYDPYGMEISVSSTPGFPSTFPSGSIESPYKYGGKEWNETTSTYDFEARYLSPSFHRFTTMDPLAEKYYSISPYAYCVGNPVNLVDPDGMQWYLCTDAEDHTEYVYSEGAMSEEDKKKYKNVQYVDYTVIDTENNKYYSLFGRTLDWTNSDGTPNAEARIYEVIDRLLYQFFMEYEDKESIFPKKISTTISSLEDGHIYSFIYRGKTFSTDPFNRNKQYDRSANSLFYNNIGQSANIYSISHMPIGLTSNWSYPQHTDAYWLIANNPSRATRGGIRVLQLQFNEEQSQAFLRSCVSIFPESDNAKRLKNYIH